MSITLEKKVTQIQDLQEAIYLQGKVNKDLKKLAKEALEVSYAIDRLTQVIQKQWGSFTKEDWESFRKLAPITEEIARKFERDAQMYQNNKLVKNSSLFAARSLRALSDVLKDTIEFRGVVSEIATIRQEGVSSKEKKGAQALIQEARERRKERSLLTN